MCRPLDARSHLLGHPSGSLVLDEIEDTGFDLRPRLPGKARALTGPSRKLTIVDDTSFPSNIAQQWNLPDYIKTGLPAFY